MSPAVSSAVTAKVTVPPAVGVLLIVSSLPPVMVSPAGTEPDTTLALSVRVPLPPLAVIVWL